MKLRDVYEKYGTQTKLNIIDVDGDVYRGVTIFSFTDSNDDEDGANIDIHIPGTGYFELYEHDIKSIEPA